MKLQPIEQNKAKTMVDARLKISSLADMAILDDLDSIDNNNSSYKTRTGNQGPDLKVERGYIAHPYPSLIDPASSLVNISID